MENETCLFLNTDQLPIKVNRMGLFRVVKTREQNRFMELCEEIYQHPQAPESATVSLLRFLPINCPIESTMLLCIEAMQDIAKVCEIDYSKVNKK